MKLSVNRVEKIWALAIPSGVGIAFFTLAMSNLDHFTIEGVRFLELFFGAFVLYLLAVILLYNRQLSTRGSFLILIFLVAFIQRVPLWGTEPTLSNDIWRYLWDGRLVSLGVNPYAEPVNSPNLDEYDAPSRARVDHDWMASPYPPTAQLAFSGTYALAPDSPTAFQLAFTLFDLATGAVLVLFLKRLNMPLGRVALYLWNPLIIVEFAHGAHLDSLLTLLVILALYLFCTGRRTGSAVALALATLTKFIPALLVPVTLRRWGFRRALLYFAVIALGLLPFIGAGLGLLGELDGRGIFGAVRIYNSLWKTNDGVFYWLARVLEPLSSDPIALARGVSFTLLLLAGLWVFNASRGDASEPNPVQAIHRSALLIGAYVLLSPVVFPWYLTLLLALLPLLQTRKNRPVLFFLGGWLYFSAAVNLSYLTYLDPANPQELEWVRSVEYIPLWIALAGALYLLRRNRTRPPYVAHPASTVD